MDKRFCSSLFAVLCSTTSSLVNIANTFLPLQKIEDGMPFLDII